MAVEIIWSGRHRSLALHDLRRTIGRHCPSFRGKTQQDAHEFFLCLHNFLHEELNEERPDDQRSGGPSDARSAKLAWHSFMRNNRSITLSLFWGQQRSTIQCSLCGNQSANFEPLSHLSVPVPDNMTYESLSRCVEQYTAADIIGGWMCPKCSSNTKTTKKTDIWRLPPVLVIHLHRGARSAGIKTTVGQLVMSPPFRRCWLRSVVEH